MQRLHWNTGTLVFLESKLCITTTWGRFNQLSTYSFYAQGAQMREKDSQVVSIFTLSGSTSVKAERKCVGEIDTWRMFF